MTSDGTALINSLLRGVHAHNVETVRDAWRGLLAAGGDVVPLVQEKLRSPAWAKSTRWELVAYLTVLLSLLGELDPQVFKREVKRMRAGKLHTLYGKILDAMASRINARPATHIDKNIPVYLADDIEDRATVIACLERWSRTAGPGLEGVTGVNIIAHHPDFEYLGKYNLFFSGILLTWPTERGGPLRRWWRRYRAEFTFYHEVGHHACGHLQGGQVEEQEQEANRYARSMMRRSRPVSARIVRLVMKLIKPTLRWFLMIAERRA